MRVRQILTATLAIIAFLPMSSAQAHEATSPILTPSIVGQIGQNAPDAGSVLFA